MSDESKYSYESKRFKCYKPLDEDDYLEPGFDSWREHVERQSHVNRNLRL